MKFVWLILFLSPLVTAYDENQNAGQGAAPQDEEAVASLAAHVERTVRANHADGVQVHDVLMCVLCVSVLGEMKTKMDDPGKEAELEKAIISSLCPILPPEFECEKRVKMYGPMVYQLVKKRLDPKTFCQDISLCADSPVLQTLDSHNDSQDDSPGDSPDDSPDDSQGDSPTQDSPNNLALMAALSPAKATRSDHPDMDTTALHFVRRFAERFVGPLRTEESTDK